MNSRRDFIKTSFINGISLLTIPGFAVKCLSQEKLNYRLTRDVPTKLYDGEQCWVHPRAGTVPGAGKDGLPRVVFTMSKLDLSGSDVFRAMYGFYTDDFGSTWTDPQEVPSLGPRYETMKDVKHPVTASDFWPKYHKATQTLLGIGHTVVYTPEWKVMVPRPRHTSYSVYNPTNNTWDDWKKLIMPDENRFYFAGAGSVQRFDEEDGTILVPVYFNPPQPDGKRSDRIIVMRCGFDGQELTYKTHDNEISIDDTTRGFQEPSVTRFDGTYFLTIRNNLRGYVTKSSDGINYEPVKSWTFDDGSDLGTYNTQTHWVSHSDGLFLVYTRRGANNDHVMRHRAPLFMGRVDSDRLCVIRDSEKILVPERGARLGNFGVTDVSPDETWVTVAEWMQYSGKSNEKTPDQVAKHGSDGSVWVARINWNKPNLNFKN